MFNIKYRRMLSALTSLLLLACTLFMASCEKEEEPPLSLTDEEAREILKSLVPESKEINEIFFGSGLPAVDEAYEAEPTPGANYFAVRDDCGYSSIAEIKAAAEKVYTKAYLEKSVYVGAFEGTVTESDDAGLVDSSLDPRYKEIGGVLKVNISCEGYELKTEPLTGTAVVTEATADYVKVTLSYAVDGKEAGTMTVCLAPQDGVWLLDSPTY